MKMIVAIALFLFSQVCLSATPVYWAGVIISTPQGVTYYHDCVGTRMRFQAHDQFDTEFRVNCQSSDTTPPMAGVASYGDMPIRRVQVNFPNLDRFDCQFVSMSYIGSNGYFEMECGWSYSMSLFNSGFEGVK